MLSLNGIAEMPINRTVSELCFRFCLGLERLVDYYHANK